MENENKKLHSYDIGGTAFVLKSHQLKYSKEIMHCNNQELLEALLIRPQLGFGDALLFDCRILHFGLANACNHEECVEKEEFWRPLLYINYTHTWFEDPKNWNNRRKLFPEHETNSNGDGK